MGTVLTRVCRIFGSTHIHNPLKLLIFEMHAFYIKYMLGEKTIQYPNNEEEELMLGEKRLILIWMTLKKSGSGLTQSRL